MSTVNNGDSGLTAPDSSSADQPIMQPKHLFYDENAERISNMIDDELKVCRVRSCRTDPLTLFVYT
jgi:hypothetical protein